MNEFEYVSSKLFTTFNDIVYYDEPHKYFYGGKQFTSVTTLIHKYQEPFDEEYWSQYKANEFGIEQHSVKRAWNFINKKGTMKGSIIHDYGENKLHNKVFKYPETEILKEFGFDPIKLEYEKTKNHVDKFIGVSKGKLIPIRTELVMYDVESQIAGMADLLFYNVRDKEIQIWDWKTNKKFSYENKNKNLGGVLNTIEDCDLEIYSLQLETYKYIIEKNTGLKLGKSFLIWVSHNNDDFQIIETKNRRYFVECMFKERIEELTINN